MKNVFFCFYINDDVTFDVFYDTQKLEKKVNRIYVTTEMPRFWPFALLMETSAHSAPNLILSTFFNNSIRVSLYLLSL